MFFEPSKIDYCVKLISKIMTEQPQQTDLKQNI